MKIGVAFSGSGAGAAAANVFVDELLKRSVAVDMLSATSLAAVPSLLWSRGAGLEELEELMTLFSASQTPQLGLRQLDRMGMFRAPAVCDLAVSCVDASTGITVIYSDTLHSDAWNLKVLPLSGNEPAALACALSPYRDSEPFVHEGMRLCDFSVRYGCPFFPLKMAGMERILSVSFSGGESPAQVAADTLSALTGKNADLHYDLRFGGADIPEKIRAFMEEHIAEIYEKLLF